MHALDTHTYTRMLVFFLSHFHSVSQSLGNKCMWRLLDYNYFYLKATQNTQSLHKKHLQLHLYANQVPC